MSKNGALNTLLLHDELQWYEIEPEVRRVYPRDAAKLNCLFADRRETVQKSQKFEANGQRTRAFLLLTKLWLKQIRINKIIKKSLLETET